MFILVFFVIINIFYLRIEVHFSSFHWEIKSNWTIICKSAEARCIFSILSSLHQTSYFSARRP